VSLFVFTLSSQRNRPERKTTKQINDNDKKRISLGEQIAAISQAKAVWTGGELKPCTNPLPLF